MPAFTYMLQRDKAAAKFLQSNKLTKDLSKVRANTTQLQLEYTCRGWDRLEKFTRLRALCIYGTPTTEQLEDIVGLPQLEILCLSNTRTKDFSELSRMRRLRCLAIDYAPQLRSLDFVTAMSGLETLAIQDSKGLHDIEAVGDLKKLRELHLVGGLFDEPRLDSIRAIASLKKLEYLVLSVRTEEGSLESLGELNTLKDLQLGSTFPSEEFAWLAGRLKTKKFDIFNPPHFSVDGVPCTKCGKSECVFPLGRGKRRICQACQPERIAAFVAEFEGLRDLAAAGKYTPPRKKVVKKSPAKKKASKKKRSPASKGKKVSKKRRAAKPGTTLRDVSPETREVIEAFKRDKHDYTLRDGHVVQLSVIHSADDELAKMIGRLSELKSLCLSCEQDRILSALEGLKKLEELELLHGVPSNKAIKSLGKMTALRNLEIGFSDTMVTDKGIAHLKPLCQLERLSIFDANITDASIPLLRGFKKLKSLFLGDVKLTDKGMETLSNALPKCEITID